MVFFGCLTCKVLEFTYSKLTKFVFVLSPLQRHMTFPIWIIYARELSCKMITYSTHVTLYLNVIKHRYWNIIWTKLWIRETSNQFCMAHDVWLHNLFSHSKIDCVYYPLGWPLRIKPSLTLSHYFCLGYMSKSKMYQYWRYDFITSKNN